MDILISAVPPFQSHVQVPAVGVDTIVQVPGSAAYVLLVVVGVVVELPPPPPPQDESAVTPKRNAKTRNNEIDGCREVLSIFSPVIE
jgi:hypothetical protein